MKVIVLSSRYANGTSKKGNAYNGFFTDVVHFEKGENRFKSRSIFLGIDVMQGIVPEPGMVLDVETGFGTTFIDNVEIVKDSSAMLMSFLAPFQEVLSKSKGN